ncbi:hypothetical protein ACTJJB_01570 [Chitinophaga sp. 22536]|uniref:hypothetical protein n=1 Tax=unclassified Chitinophaga TaxID=2619133 RepID=UPI003F874869
MNEQLKHYIVNNPDVEAVYMDGIGNFVTAPCAGYSKVLTADLEDGSKKPEEAESSNTESETSEEATADLEDGSKKPKNKK